MLRKYAHLAPIPKKERILASFSGPLGTLLGDNTSPMRPNIRSRSFTSSTIPENETIEGVWAFHRHGDRAPSRPLIATHMIEREEEYWKTKIPPLDRSYYHALSDIYHTSIHKSNNNGKFLDADGGREPYGFLTWKGMDQMYHTGKRIAQRYNCNGNDFLNEWDLSGYSTNYLRTVMSVQCFMDGLLTPTSSSTTTSEGEDRHSYEHLSIEEFKSLRAPLLNNNRTKIQVRDRKEDTLNAFDKKPEYMKKLVGEVVTKKHFIEKDAKAGCLAARLANYLPGLAKASNYGGPSGINWIHAADHFVCRKSHDIPFSKFSHCEHDEEAEEILAAMSYGVVSHLSWRFRTWYQSPPLLAAISGPPLSEVEKQIRDRAETSSVNGDESHEEKKRKPFVIYSCHDVTILSLLYGVGADFLSSKEDLIKVGLNPGNDERWRFWPRYASTLVFELVRKDDPSSDSSTSTSQFVRILLNGKEIRPLSMLQNKKSVLSVSDFKALVAELNSKNGDENGVEMDDNERDMSNWTG